MEMPYSKVIEEDCLGGMMVCTYYLTDPFYLQDPDFVKLDVDDFYLWQHQKVYATMLWLAERALEPNENNVKDELERSAMLEQVGGRDFIHHLVYCALSQSGYRGFDPYYRKALIVRSYRLRREMLVKALAMAQAALDFSKPMQVHHDQ
jgi:replicative DNA helicase